MGFTISVAVKPVLKEFIECVHGSSTIVLKEDDLLSQKVKYILQRMPSDFIPVNHDPCSIKIEIGDVFMFKTRSGGCLFHADPQYRSFLNARLQHILAKELNKGFKEIMHNYVLAYARAGREQNEGIEDFCSVYNLTMNAITFDMLKKSWQRSDQYQMFKKLRITMSPANL
ncbi:MAG TPA: hypothetical protein VMW01_16415 [Williamwhitmania sp.]|nr:hypothetical protein [Williamwhitmania sp.]